jgi:ABC-type dipeptide/oligopeptide/nickel transport system permease component
MGDGTLASPFGRQLLLFAVKRLLTLIPLLIGVSLLVFSMLQLVPGDPVRAILGESTAANPEQVERIRQELGLDKPLHVQYLTYVGNVVRGDFGTSIRTRKPVLEQIMLRLPSTLELTLAGLGFAIVFGTGLGVISALHHNTIIDKLAVLIALLGVSIPSFWLGLLLILVFSVQLNWLPVLGSSGLRGLILPTLTLGLWAAGGIARLARSSMLEVMHQDYVRTARSKGLRRHSIVILHMLRNALIPVVTIVGIRFGQVLAGTVIIETVFSRQGLGLMLVSSILGKDFPVVQGIILLVATSYVLINFLVELTYTWLDPRISYS